MTLRGREWMIYTDDDGGRWLLEVDSDYAADPDRGWAGRTSGDLAVWPTAWRPREVVGIEEDGRLQHTRVGHPAAPLWTGAALSFVVWGSDEGPHDVRVFRYVSERKRPFPTPLP